MAGKKSAKSTGPTRKRAQSTTLTRAVDVEQEVRNRIVTVRGQQVVLDSDLADFYGVEVRALNQAVTRNPERFPDDFAFRMTRDEADELKSQNVISDRSARRSTPRVFTEQGALAVSGVLKSAHAAKVSVAVARAFVAMRDTLRTLEEHPAFKDISAQLGELAVAMQDQEDFNQAVRDCLAEMEGIIEKQLGSG